ncbi:MAG TPA: hypothetical protein VFY38_09905 [Pseudonocardia sp.]|nr:hypothetical protein [Pseudonocardia sp.]
MRRPYLPAPPPPAAARRARRRPRPPRSAAALIDARFPQVERSVAEVGERCVIVCRSCSSATNPLMIPFRSYRERALWATGHTARTGHDRWFCLDGFPTIAEAVQEIAISDTVEKWIAEPG